MTLSQLIEELEKQQRIVGGEAPVRTVFSVHLQCEECGAESTEDLRGLIHDTKIEAGTIALIADNQ